MVSLQCECGNCSRKGERVIREDEFRKKQNEYLKKLSLKSDVCFRVAARLCSPGELERLMELLAAVITGRGAGPFHDVQSQKDLKTVTGAKSVIPDLFGYDQNDESWSIEVQNDSIDKGRMEVHTAHLVLNGLCEGESYSMLKKCHSIWMTDAEKLTGMDGPLFPPGEAVIHVDQVIRETGERFRTKKEVILFNLRYRGKDERGALARDLCEADPEKIQHPLLKDLLRRIKYTVKGEMEMCEVTRQIFQDGKAEGLSEGLSKGLSEGLRKGEKVSSLKTAGRMLKKKCYSLQEIAELTSLSVDEVQKLQADCS